MAYPDDLDTFPTAADLADDTLATKPHSTLHGNLGVAVRALEELVGVNGVNVGVEGNGPPDSTSAQGSLYLAVAAGTGGVYFNTAATPATDPAIWTLQAGANAGHGAKDPSVSGQAASAGDFFVRIYIEPAAGWLTLLYQKGAGGDTDWSILDAVALIDAATPTNAADATGEGVAGLGARYYDRTSTIASQWVNVGTSAAPTWLPRFGSLEAPDAPVDSVVPGHFIFVNYLFPSGDGLTTPEGTYANIRDSFADSDGGGPQTFLGVPMFLGVRIAALFAHVLPTAAMEAGVVLRWDEVNYLFSAYKPTANPEVWVELGDSDTILAGGRAQLLVQMYDQ